MALSDVLKFAGQFPARVRPVLARLAPSLREFRDEGGRVLYDLPRAPRPPEDAKAPVRFLPRFDELLVAYQHRDRVMAERYRPAVYGKNAIIEAVVLVDGFGAGTWALERTKTDAVVRVRPFRRLAARERAEVIAEGTRLARFLAPDARTAGAKIA